MDIPKNARTTPHSRMLMIERLNSGWTVPQVAAAQDVDGKTVRKWGNRFATEGRAGLADRSSRPHRNPTRLAHDAEDQIEALRRTCMAGPAIARQLDRPLSTVGVVLRRRGLGRFAALDPRPPVRRYQREQPGELIHICERRPVCEEGRGGRRAPEVLCGRPWTRSRTPWSPGLCRASGIISDAHSIGSFDAADRRRVISAQDLAG